MIIYDTYWYILIHIDTYCYIMMPYDIRINQVSFYWHLIIVGPPRLCDFQHPKYRHRQWILHQQALFVITAITIYHPIYPILKSKIFEHHETIQNIKKIIVNILETNPSNKWTKLSPHFATADTSQAKPLSWYSLLGCLGRRMVLLTTIVVVYHTLEAVELLVQPLCLLRHHCCWRERPTDRLHRLLRSERPWRGSMMSVDFLGV